MPNFSLSTSAWLESIAKKEIEKQWWKIIEVVDRLITFEWDFTIAAKVNIWSRVGNKLYLELVKEEAIEDFDDLYWLVTTIECESLVPKDAPIIIKATSLRSELHHTPTIQSITKKSIIDRLLKHQKEDTAGDIFENDDLPRFEVLTLLINNTARVLLNISGDALHKRWYRKDAWEAPIKETLAAGLVLLSSWRFRDALYDPFSGSWTIPIEAAMIAKNIAPWLKREFSIVDLWFISAKEMADLKKEAREKQFNWEYKIFASDIDVEVLRIAESNAYDAWVVEDIQFSVKDFSKEVESGIIIEWTLVTNPPYGERLQPENLEILYKWLHKVFSQNKNLSWGFISNYEEFDNFVPKDFYKKRKLYNWGEKCYFWKKK